MAIDMSARPHEILGLKIKDIKFCITDENVQYAEVRIKDGKTGPRTIPLIDSIPYLKEWLQEHPTQANSNSWLFTIFANNSDETKLTYEGLASRYEYYKKRYFPSLLEDNIIPEADKAIIRNLLTKPWNLYILRHSALTEKSQYLTEPILRSHAGWTMSSKMPQVYIHLSGEPSKILLQKRGILKKENVDITNTLRSKQCPNCFESNKQDNRFCVKCKMVLSYDFYKEIRSDDKNKIEKLENEMGVLKEGMNKIFLLIQQNPILTNTKPEVLTKIIEKNPN
jgi:integrase/recombinase XerD